MKTNKNYSKYLNIIMSQRILLIKIKNKLNYFSKLNQIRNKGSVGLMRSIFKRTTMPEIENREFAYKLWRFDFFSWYFCSTLYFNLASNVALISLYLKKSKDNRWNRPWFISTMWRFKILHFLKIQAHWFPNINGRIKKHTLSFFAFFWL